MREETLGFFNETIYIHLSKPILNSKKEKQEWDRINSNDKNVTITRPESYF